MRKSAAADRPLDVSGKDRVHALFSGTTLVNASAGALSEAEEGKPGEAVPAPPDGGGVGSAVWPLWRD